MTVMEAVRTRKSVRDYLDKPVEDEKLQSVLEAARLAPSASNRQEWRFVVVRDPATRRNVVKMAGAQSFVGDAAVLIVACAETNEHVMKCGQQCYPIDVAIALDHLTLAAVELGLGTCWIGSFEEHQVKQALHIPDEIRVVALLPLGYPADPVAIDKKGLALHDIVHCEQWQPQTTSAAT